MKYNKKKCMAARCLRGMLALTVLSAMLGLAACRTETGDMDNTEASGNNHTAGSVSQEDSRPPDSAADQTAADVPKRPLTQEELRGFEEYLNRADNYGFLLSDYRSPEYINLDEVFYSGAGLEQPQLTEDERDMYLETVGARALYGHGEAGNRTD